ncbi:MAG TPA: hypothetical protein VF633_10015 [Brevundimonas sp.]|jgi:hypothetical protein
MIDRHAMKCAPVLAAMTLFVALAACDDVKTPASTAEAPAKSVTAAFTHQISSDLSGYYIPATPISVDGYRVKALFLGQGADFAAWEGGAKSGGFAPVMIEFEKNGATPIRVLPQTYSVSDGRVRFEGVDPRLGNVAFTGTLDQNALATARRNLGDEAPVLTGTLRAGGTAFGHQKFRWYGGD